MLPHLSRRGISGSRICTVRQCIVCPITSASGLYVFPSVVRSSLGVRCALCFAYRCEGGVSMLGAARDSACSCLAMWHWVNRFVVRFAPFLSSRRLSLSVCLLTEWMHALSRPSDTLPAGRSKGKSAGISLGCGHLWRWLVRSDFLYNLYEKSSAMYPAS